MAQGYNRMTKTLQVVGSISTWGNETFKFSFLRSGIEAKAWR